MFSFYRAAKQLKRDLKRVTADRDHWKAEAARLSRKLEDRTDHFVEREFRFVDRFLTAKAKTFAITDEVKAAREEATEIAVENEAWDAYKADKIAFLIECAANAGRPHPEAEAHRTFEQNYASYRLEFEGQ